MSEPITIYCTVAHEWGARKYRPGDAMTLVSPSLVRDLLVSGRWSLAEPEPVVVAPVEVASASAQPVTPKRKPRRL
jgi:hypothetical protein